MKNREKGRKCRKHTTEAIKAVASTAFSFKPLPTGKKSNLSFSLKVVKYDNVSRCARIL